MERMLLRFGKKLVHRMGLVKPADVWAAALACMFAAAGSREFSPFGPAAVAGAWLLGPFPFGALAGALLGAALGGHMRALAAASLYAGAGLLLGFWRERPGRAEKLLLLAGAELLMLPFFAAKSAETLLMGTASLAAAVAAAVVMGRGGAALRRLHKGKLLSRRAKYAALFLLLLVTAASPVIRLNLRGGGPFGREFAFFFGAAFAAFFALFAVENLAREGVAFSVLFGAAAMLQGADIARMGMLALASLIASFPEKASRRAAVFLAASLAAVLVFALPPAAFFEALLGSCAYLLFAKRGSHGAGLFSEHPVRGEAERILALTRARLRGAADVVRALSDVFSQGADDTAAFTHRQLSGVSGVMERLAEEVPFAGGERFSVSVGSAACPKAGNAETGDSMAQRRIGGAQLLILSDGMGTGRCAQRESSVAVDLFGDLLSVGFAPEEAEECVNRLLMAKGEREMYATLDALLIDLLDGRARFIKFGAPPAYILREGKVHTVYAEALPIGILEEASPSVQEVQLKRGDVVVMMTDGLFDALGTELFAALLEKAGAGAAEDAAKAILSLGRPESGADDMSVFVARIA